MQTKCFLIFIANLLCGRPCSRIWGRHKLVVKYWWKIKRGYGIGLPGQGWVTTCKSEEGEHPLHGVGLGMLISIHLSRAVTFAVFTVWLFFRRSSRKNHTPGVTSKTPGNTGQCKCSRNWYPRLLGCMLLLLGKLSGFPSNPSYFIWNIQIHSASKKTAWPKDV